MIITNSLQAEKSVLSTLLSYEDQYDVASELISADDFESVAHQDLYKVAAELFEQNKVCDPFTLREVIESRFFGTDFDYLDKRLTDVIATPAALPKSFLAHVELVKQASLRRRSIKILEDGLGQLKRYEDVQDTQSMIVSELSNIEQDDGKKQVFDFDDMTAGVFAKIEEARSGVKPYLDTGFPDLDSLMQVNNGDLVVVAARPSIGKSLISVNMQTHLAKYKDGASVFFSVEMDEVSVQRRIIASECSIPIPKVQDGSMDADEWARFQKFVSDRPTERLKVVRDTNLDVSSIRRNLVRLKREHGRISSVGIDYLQLMSGLSGDDSVKRIGDVTRSLKLMADEFACPIFLLSQLNRAVEKRPNKRPTMSDLRDSGSIEQDADVIMFLYREDYYKKMAGETDFDGMADIIIGKNRNGETGTKRLAFEGHMGRFSNHMPFDAGADNIPNYGE